jgi:uncharacterized protein (TIGR00369 family)
MHIALSPCRLGSGLSTTNQAEKDVKICVFLEKIIAKTRIQQAQAAINNVAIVFFEKLLSGADMYTLDSIHPLVSPYFPGLMAIRFTALENDRIVATLQVRKDLCTPGDILHGGAYMAFADTLGAVGTVMNLPQGKRTTTTDSSTKFMAGAKLGSTVTGTSVALHRGRTTMVWQTSITNEAGKLCAVVTQTQLVLEAAVQP